MNFVNFKTRRNLDFNIENNYEVLKFKVSDHVDYQNMRNIFQKCPIQIGYKKFYS